MGALNVAGEDTNQIEGATVGGVEGCGGVVGEDFREDVCGFRGGGGVHGLNVGEVYEVVGWFIVRV